MSRIICYSWVILGWVRTGRGASCEVYRILRPSGRFLLDLTDYDYVWQHFVAESWHEETDDVVVCWKREWRDDVIHVREMVLSKAKGLLRDRTYAERIYQPTLLHGLLREAGFVTSSVHPDAFVFSPVEGTDYGIATHRTLMTAVKG